MEGTPESLSSTLNDNSSRDSHSRLHSDHSRERYESHVIHSAQNISYDDKSPGLAVDLIPPPTHSSKLLDVVQDYSLKVGRLKLISFEK